MYCKKCGSEMHLGEKEINTREWYVEEWWDCHECNKTLIYKGNIDIKPAMKFIEEREL